MGRYLTRSVNQPPGMEECVFRRMGWDVYHRGWWWVGASLSGSIIPQPMVGWCLTRCSITPRGLGNRSPGDGG